MIALESNSKHGKWINCYCTMNCGKDRCTLGTCPGSKITGSDWEDCTSERFWLYVMEKLFVAVTESPFSTDRGTWLSCYGSGSVCPTRPSPTWNGSLRIPRNVMERYFGYIHQTAWARVQPTREKATPEIAAGESP